MKVIILAAGKGSRLGEFHGDKPKCLLKIGEESLLEREIRFIKEAGIKESDIYVVGGYKYELLKGIASNLIINEEYERKDNSYSLFLALQSVPDDDVMILDSDLYFEKGILNELLLESHANVLMSKASKDEKESTGIVTDKNGKVSAIGKQYSGTGFVYISIFKIGREARSDFLVSLNTERSEKTWYTHALTEICRIHPFYNHVTELKWHEIDYETDYWETLELFGGKE